MSNTQASYTRGSIGGTMLKTAASMIPATLAISGYNIVNTYFVAKLGTLPLAAMGFTFPMVMLIGCVYRGLGVGAMTPLAHALGRKNLVKAAKLTSAGLLLIILLSAVIGATGYFSIDWTFRQFGAGKEVMPMIHDYMAIWYLGSVTGAVSMTCNDLMIATGSTKTASSMMLGGMLLNAVLDPLCIFGLLGFPAMGIKGAAAATIFSQALVSIVLFLLLHYRHHLLNLKIFQWRLLKNSWMVVIRVAIPSIIGILLMPIGNGVITRIVAEFGDEAVAACAAAGRMEVLAFVVPMALGISLMPMVAQNFGARQYERINECRRFSMRFAGFFGLFMAVLYLMGAKYLPPLFSSDQRVISIMTQYLLIISWGFGMMEIHRYCGFFYTGCNRPAMAAWLNTLRVAGLLIPFSLLALYFHSLTGLFVARLLADVIAGVIGLWLVSKMTRKLLYDKSVVSIKPCPEAELKTVPLDVE